MTGPDLDNLGAIDLLILVLRAAQSGFRSQREVAASPTYHMNEDPIPHLPKRRSDHTTGDGP